jgi:hypothetical protein
MKLGFNFFAVTKEMRNETFKTQNTKNTTYNLGY